MISRIGKNELWSAPLLLIGGSPNRWMEHGPEYIESILSMGHSAQRNADDEIGMNLYVGILFNPQASHPPPHILQCPIISIGLTK